MRVEVPSRVDMQLSSKGWNPTESCTETSVDEAAEREGNLSKAQIDDLQLTKKKREIAPTS